MVEETQTKVERVENQKEAIVDACDELEQKVIAMSDDDIAQLEASLNEVEKLKEILDDQMKLRPTIAMSTEFFKLIEHITVIKRTLGRDLNDSISNLKALLPEHIRKLDLDEEYMKIVNKTSSCSRSEKKLICSYMYITAARNADAIARAKKAESEHVEEDASDKATDESDTTTEEVGEATSQTD